MCLMNIQEIINLCYPILFFRSVVWLLMGEDYWLVEGFLLLILLVYGCFLPFINKVILLYQKKKNYWFVGSLLENLGNLSLEKVSLSFFVTR